MKKLIVKTENGFIEGLHGWDPRIAVFKGVPYAKPPVGELRFRSPQPLENWEGVLQAFDYATVSMQQTPGIDKESFWTKEMHPTGPEYEVSEDCLYMNIFTPARSDKEMLPVLFYIHGGGFTGGYPSEMWFAYDSLARSNRPFTGKHYDLARQISSYWTNFVRTGDPNGKETFGNDMPGYGCDLPRWEPFTKEDEFLMLFTDGPSQRPLCTDEKTKKLIEEKTGLKI